ncbi:MAG TPA: LysM peptidoglycan-binding domain-containing protein [Gemmatimonadales bacterium]|jgi:LysM repeat protein
MRRTTIFRSSLAALAALTAGAVSIATAQIPVQRSITQAQQAQQGQRSAPPAAPVPADRSGAVQMGGSGAVQMGGASGAQPVSSTPATHTVAPGETLWGLAQTYLGDPMLWPEIYRLNTTVIEDPHWIYPGEELRLSGATAAQPAADTSATAAPSATATAPAADTAVTVSPQSQTVTLTPSTDSSRQVTPEQQQPTGVAPLNGPTIFSERPARNRSAPSIEVASARAYRAVREGEYFSSGFLTENQPLPSGRIVNTAGETRGQRGHHTAQLYESVVVAPPPGDPPQAGDMLLSFVRTEDLGEFGQIVLPTGLIKVTGPAGTGNNLIAGEVVRIYAPVEDSQEVLKVQPFVNNSNLRAEPVTGGVEGHVIRLRDARNTAMLQDVMFIDKGANDGLRLGDILQVYAVRTDPEHPGSFEQDQARAIIVSTRSRTATAVIVELYRGDVSSRSQVRQVRRMPS